MLLDNLSVVSALCGAVLELFGRPCVYFCINVLKLGIFIVIYYVLLCMVVGLLNNVSLVIFFLFNVSRKVHCACRRAWCISFHFNKKNWFRFWYYIYLLSECFFISTLYGGENNELHPCWYYAHSSYWILIVFICSILFHENKKWIFLKLGNIFNL